MRRCPVDGIDAVFAKINKTSTLYLPTDTNGGAAYTKWQSGAVLSKALNTVKSVKELFFPQTEELVRFRTAGKNIHIEEGDRSNEAFTVFGVRACDVKSLDILDRVFTEEPADSYYTARRENGVIIALACTHPSENCFCNTFGIAPEAPGGDISAWKTATHYYFEANTEKGRRLMAELETLTQECDSEAVEERKREIAELMRRLPLKNLGTEGFGGGQTARLFDSPAWEELSATCLGCGSCTMVCPTCQCYDIKDFNTGNGVIRYRCWDSCMYSEFTQMAHGNNRPTQKERFRQRFMHKLVYYPENNNGIFGCVGCGRCLSACPINMSIVKVMSKLGGKTDAE